MRIVPGRLADAAAITEVYLRSRDGAGAAIPPGIHPPDEVRDYVAQVVLTRKQAWLARTGADTRPGTGDAVTDAVTDAVGDAVGVLVLDPHATCASDPVPVIGLDWLWVLPQWQGRGVGSRLLEHARSLAPAGLGLWTFVSNTPACSFYERRGFTSVATTEGDNEEGAPDVRYVWLPGA